MELRTYGLEKSFNKRKVVQDVSLSLSNGVHALLGANGSGKTTLIRMLVGTLPPSSGSVMFDNIDISEQYDSYCASLGYMPQHFGFYPNYTVEEFLMYMGLLKKIKKRVCQTRVTQLLEQLNLSDVKKKKMKTLSGGMLRRVGIAQALLSKPKILILDEPTAGLDPKERVVLRNLIASLSNRCIILLSTHIVSDIETIADDIIVMKDGKIIEHDTCQALLDFMKNKVFQVVVDREDAKDILAKYIVVKSHQMNGQIELRIVSDVRPHARAQNVEPDLDDYYLYHFTKGGVDNDAFSFE